MFEPTGILKILISYISQAWEIIKLWWWLPLPFIAWRQFKFFWKWWRTDLFLKRQKMILLEIRMPKEVLKPIRAMEVVMDSLHKIIYKPPDLWEKYIDGEVQLSYAFEIASINGEAHFFVRFSSQYRDPVEAAIYSQYPEAEILLVEDYTKHIPQDIPNRDWDLWSADYALVKEDAYPVKTYKSFETESEGVEEKRVDPVANLLELTAKIKQGEQLWIQILAEPVTRKEKDWIGEGEKIKDKLARRPGKTGPQAPLIMEAADVIITGNVPGQEEKKEEIIPPEMKLTPGEREIISGVEQKISKPGFICSARFIYLGKRDVFFKSNLRLALSFFGTYATENLNAFKPYGQPFMTKIKKSFFLPKNLLRKRRMYLRQRRVFRHYRERYHPYFPRSAPGRKGDAVFTLNTEELASLFHFPSRRVASAPFVPRIEAKKGEAPPGLPTG